MYIRGILNYNIFKIEFILQSIAKDTRNYFVSDNNYKLNISWQIICILHISFKNTCLKFNLQKSLHIKYNSLKNDNILYTI